MRGQQKVINLVQRDGVYVPLKDSEVTLLRLQGKITLEKCRQQGNTYGYFYLENK